MFFSGSGCSGGCRPRPPWPAAACSRRTTTRSWLSVVPVLPAAGAADAQLAPVPVPLSMTPLSSWLAPLATSGSMTCLQSRPGTLDRLLVVRGDRRDRVGRAVLAVGGERRVGRGQGQRGRRAGAEGDDGDVAVDLARRCPCAGPSWSSSSARCTAPSLMHQRGEGGVDRLGGGLAEGSSACRRLASSLRTDHSACAARQLPCIGWRV